MSQPLTVASALVFGTNALSNHSDSAKLDSEVLLLHVLQKTRSFLFTWPEQVLTEKEQHQFESLISKRALGHPVAHLTGEREFWSLPLKVNPSTLIPRPDTETLIETALNHCQKATGTILDLGTGSGAIALALASELPQWQIIGCDFQPDAVTLANSNKTHLNLPNVNFLHSDWFSHIPKQRFDVIVSNPPYIDPDDHHLQQGDVRFEPLSALIADKKGMADIEQIIEQARDFLCDNGCILIEHGYDQGKLVRDYFAKMAYKEAITIKDLANNDRVTLAFWRDTTH